jgi:hypothetical protein
MTMSTATWVPRAQYGGMNRDEAGPAAKPRKRTFTPRYKLDILSGYEGLTDAGAKGSLLRREGLYSSHRGVAQSPGQRGPEGACPQVRQAQALC